MTTCLVGGCIDAARTRGLCDAHYARKRRHGNPLAGGTYRGDPKNYLYNIVFHHTGEQCLIWPFGCDDKGGAKIKVAGKPIRVSRIVCEFVHGTAPTKKHEAAHSCGNGSRGCVSKHHLSWKTHLENEADKLIHGTLTYGERNGRAKLSAFHVREILALQGGMTQREIAIRFGVSKTLVSNIHAGKRWSHLARAGGIGI